MAALTFLSFCRNDHHIDFYFPLPPTGKDFPYISQQCLWIIFTSMFVYCSFTILSSLTSFDLLLKLWVQSAFLRILAERASLPSKIVFRFSWRPKHGHLKTVIFDFSLIRSRLECSMNLAFAINWLLIVVFEI